MLVEIVKVGVDRLAELRDRTNALLPDLPEAPFGEGNLVAGKGHMIFTGWKCFVDFNHEPLVEYHNRGYFSQWIWMTRQDLRPTAVRSAADLCDFYSSMPVLSCEPFSPGATFKISNDDRPVGIFADISDADLKSMIEQGHGILRSIVNAYFKEEVLRPL